MDRGGPLITQAVEEEADLVIQILKGTININI
jgi:hypothetical protein